MAKFPERLRVDVSVGPFMEWGMRHAELLGKHRSDMPPNIHSALVESLMEMCELPRAVMEDKAERNR